MPNFDNYKQSLEKINIGTVFKDCPNQTIIQKFIDYVEGFGKPHLFPSISNKKPDKDQPIKLLKKFSIPRKFWNSPQSGAPCPICSPYNPKFRDGYLVWCPEDGLIRAIGHDCGRKFYGEKVFSREVSIYNYLEDVSYAK